MKKGGESLLDVINDILDFSKSVHTLTVVDRARKAIDKVSTKKYDLILMDIQMPEMDGLTATTIIRGIEKEKNEAPSLIYAFTANALLSDEEKSLKAGCDGHLTKPLSRQKLLSVIEECSKKSSSR